MKKKILAAMIVLLFLMAGTAARAGEIVQMSEHGSLWQLAQECGQPGAAWPAIAAANPWLKVKMIKGRPVARVQAGQPIILPDGWSLQTGDTDADDESGDSVLVFGTLWADFCDMAKNYPMPTILLVFVIIVVIVARSVVVERRKRRESVSVAELETTRSSRLQRGQWESVLLPR